MDRVLTWHFPLGVRSGPIYYMETDYHPEAVRIYAESPPGAGDLEVDIFDDGVSIFNDHAGMTVYPGTAFPYYTRTPNTKVTLVKGETEELYEEDFTGAEIEEGSKVSCSLGSDGGAYNITVHLELSKMSQPEEVADE